MKQSSIFQDCMHSLCLKPDPFTGKVTAAIVIPIFEEFLFSGWRRVRVYGFLILHSLSNVFWR